MTLTASFISPDEHRERQRRLAAAIVERGLAGVVVWSRGGGGPVDQYGDVMYLTGHQNPVPQLVDARVWHGRGHAVAIVDGDGRSLLITDMLPPDGSFVADDAREAIDLPRAVAEALRDLRLDAERLGQCSAAVLLERDAAALRDAATRPLRFESVEDLLEEMRMVKSESELDLMRYAARAGCAWMSAMFEAAEPGRTEAEVVGAGLKVLAEWGGRPYDIAISSGPRSDAYMDCTVPTWARSRVLERGDLMHIDAWGPVRGYYTDLQRSTVVGGDAPGADAEHVLEAAVGLVEHVRDGVRPGVVVGDLFARAIEFLRESELATPGGEDPGAYFAELFPAFGHAIGLGVEVPWITEGERTELRPGMVLAIETFLTHRGQGAGFEHNVVVTGDGSELLDASLPSRSWRTSRSVAT